MSNHKNPVIAPSLLGADFSNLKKEINFCNNSNAKWLHLDIMDQQFVPNLSFGPGLVKSIRNHSNFNLMYKIIIFKNVFCSKNLTSMTTFKKELYKNIPHKIAFVNLIVSILTTP